MCTITAGELDFRFWTGFYGNNYDDIISWASNKAYLDMNRTLTFADRPKSQSKKELDRVEGPRKVWRDEGTKVIADAIKEPDESFEVWHKTVCKGLIAVYKKGQLVTRSTGKPTKDHTSLTYGQAQKWLNMALKYIWLLHRLELLGTSPDVEKIKDFVISYQKDFHVPLDSYILKYVAQRKKNKTITFSSKCNNALDYGRTKFSPNDFWKFFNSEWSKIDNVGNYYDYQAELAKAIIDKTPLEWELEHWHKAIEFYD